MFYVCFEALDTIRKLYNILLLCILLVSLVHKYLHTHVLYLWIYTMYLSKLSRSLSFLYSRGYLIEKFCFNFFLIQVGDLQHQLSLFWQKSKYKVGWNGAHNSFPHITLSSSFTCSDSEALDLMQTVTQVKIQKV